MTHYRRYGHRQGSVWISAVIALMVMLILALSLLAVAANLCGNSLRQVREAQALAAAEAACSRGLVMLEQRAIGVVPYSAPAIPIGRTKMDLWVKCTVPTVTAPFSRYTYEIRGTGYSGSLKRSVSLYGQYCSLLNYSRFVESGTLSYGSGANVSGQVYVGGDLTLSGSPITFQDLVTTSGTISGKNYATFQRGNWERATGISLGSSMDVAACRTLAQNGGLYYSSTGTTAIDLSQFDFSVSPPKYGSQTLSSSFNGVVFAEGNLGVKGVLQGRSLALFAGGDVYIQDNIRTGCTRTTHESPSALTFNVASGVEKVQTVQLTGLMTGVRNCLSMGISGTKWLRANVYLLEGGAVKGIATLERPSSTISGTGTYPMSTVLSRLALDPTQHTYAAEVHYWSNGTGASTVTLETAAGNPVNLALCATDDMYIATNCPQVLTVDAALFCRDGTWNTQSSTYWPCHGVWDLDQDGQIESSDDDGWDERNVGTSTWMLTINGPIITKTGGSAGIWATQGSSQNRGTRHYNYSRDIVDYPPPNFPIVMSQWQVNCWRELRGQS